MNSSDSGEDEPTSEILKSMGSNADVYKPIVTKSAPDISLSKSSVCPESEEDNQRRCSISKSEDGNTETESEADNEYTDFLKRMSIRYSQYRIRSGEGGNKKGKTMDYYDYGCCEGGEYPGCEACEEPSCSWQTMSTNAQECTPEADMDSRVYLEHKMPENGNFYSYGNPLPIIQTESNETIVNQPIPSTLETLQNPTFSTNVCNYCCPPRQPDQQPASCWSNCRYPGQEHLVHMPLPPSEVDMSMGYPFYTCPSLGTEMSYVPPMQGGCAGHRHEEKSSGNSPTSTACTDCEACNLNIEYLQKYHSALQQVHSTVQQELQQPLVQGNCQAFQGNQQYYANYNSGAQQTFACSTQATPQYYGNLNQGPYQGMQQAFSSPMDPQQYYNSCSAGAQTFLPSSMAMPAPNIFGNNTSYISDTLHSVYSSDYKSFGCEGNNFNHFPNGRDINLAPESCPAGCPGLPEMGAGGQVYVMGGAGGMNIPLNQMCYQSPYPFGMPNPSPGHGNRL